MVLNALLNTGIVINCQKYLNFDMLTQCVNKNNRHIVAMQFNLCGTFLNFEYLPNAH